MVDLWIFDGLMGICGDLRRFNDLCGLNNQPWDLPSKNEDLINNTQEPCQHLVAKNKMVKDLGRL